MANQTVLPSVDDLLGPDPAPTGAPAGGLPSVDDLLGPDPNSSPAVQAQPTVTPAPSVPGGTLGHEARLAGQSLVQGASSALGLPGDLRDLAKHYAPTAITSAADALDAKALEAVNWAREKAGLAPTKALAALPTSAELNSGAEALETKLPAIIGQQETPQNSAERYGAAALRGVGAAPAGGLAASVGGSLLGQAAQDISPTNVPLQIGAGVVGGILGHSGQGMLETAQAGRSATKGLEAAQAASDAAKIAVPQANLQATQAAENNTVLNQAASSLTKKGTQASRDVKGIVGNAIDQQQSDAEAAAHDQAQATIQASQTAHDNAHTVEDQNIQGVADTLAPSPSVVETGKFVQNAGRNFLTNTMPSAQQAAWAPVDAKVPATGTGSLGNFQTSLDRINTSAGRLEPLVKFFKNNAPASIQNTVEALSEGAGGAALTPTWSEMQALRSYIGDSIHNPQLVKDIGQQNAADMYKGITDDMQTMANKYGVGNDFQAANKTSQALYDFSSPDGPLGKFIAGKVASSADPLPAKALEALWQEGTHDDRNLTAMRQLMPDATNDVAGQLLRTNPGLFGKLTPESQAALVPDQGLRQQVLHSLAAKAQASLTHATGSQAALDQAKQAASLAGSQADALRDQAARIGEALKRNTSDMIEGRQGQSRQLLADAKAKYAQAQLENAQRAQELEAARGNPDLPANRPQAPGILERLGNSRGVLNGAMLGGLGHLGLGAALTSTLPSSLSGAWGPVAAAGAGAGLGLFLPEVARGIKAIGKNPGVLRAPAIGGALGSQPIDMRGK